MIGQCAYCQKQFRKRRSSSKYCCRKCLGKAIVPLNRRARIGSNLKCAVCGKEFYAEPNRLKRYNVRFCSRQCLAKEQLSPYIAIYGLKPTGKTKHRKYKGQQITWLTCRSGLRSGRQAGFAALGLLFWVALIGSVCTSRCSLFLFQHRFYSCLQVIARHQAPTSRGLLFVDNHESRKPNLAGMMGNPISKPIPVGNFRSEDISVFSWPFWRPASRIRQLCWSPRQEPCPCNGSVWADPRKRLRKHQGDSNRSSGGKGPASSFYLPLNIGRGNMANVTKTRDEFSNVIEGHAKFQNSSLRSYELLTHQGCLLLNLMKGIIHRIPLQSSNVRVDSGGDKSPKSKQTEERLYGEFEPWIGASTFFLGCGCWITFLFRLHFKDGQWKSAIGVIGGFIIAAAGGVYWGVSLIK